MKSCDNLYSIISIALLLLLLLLLTYYCCWC